MHDPGHLDAAMLRDWLRSAPPPPAAEPEAAQANLIRAVLDKQAGGEPLPTGVLYACVLALTAARSELDRLELDLMRAAADSGHSWAVIAEAFGYRSKQAAHARASALHHRLEYRAASPDREQ
ncbi:hypothetical protein [Nocardia huaxiensis]|uniref:hypothetical protein n=1 Tax=Nocardia huaxiensis TaxID=2755382 RepID=UPI001E54F539|nr:hypothetical protein [Nocardia huaxiensis]UFS99132.1 hypothetical protein LPY97_15145 [Nocardia huaxiensis]